MADLLIKGMDMPKTCDDCFFAEEGSWLGVQEGWEHFCTVDVDELRTVYYGERPSWCPLVEIPTHGRLIDEDALLEAIDAYGLLGNEKWHAERLVVAAPTVIEASEVENEDQ